MKVRRIQVIYELSNGRRTKASLGGNWQQWGGTSKELRMTVGLTEKLNEVVNQDPVFGQESGKEGREYEV